MRKGQRVAGGAAFTIRGRHEHFCKFAQFFSQGDYALSVDSIIVTKQNFHIPSDAITECYKYAENEITCDRYQLMIRCRNFDFKVFSC
jgi:ferritin